MKLGDKSYPSRVASILGDEAPELFEFFGTAPVPASVRLALVCSVSCPGSVIIHTYDAVRALRDANVVVAGGFHSPMEVECLEFLLRGPQPVVLCAATSLSHVALTTEQHLAMAEGRLYVLSMFGEDVARATPLHGARRNDVVAAMADAVFVPHAVPGGKAEECAAKAIRRGQSVLTLADPANEHLVKAGALAMTVERLVAVCARRPELGDLE